MHTQCRSRILKHEHRLHTATATDDGAVRAGGPPPKSFLTCEELVDLLTNHQTEPGLRDDLAELAGDTTDDLGPIR